MKQTGDKSIMPVDGGVEMKQSPWRRLRRKKSKSADHVDDRCQTDKQKVKKGIFSTPLRKMKKQSKKKKRTERNDRKDDHVTVKVLPRSPHRVSPQQIHIVQSPPRILKPHARSLETEQIFNDMFDSYIQRYHNHGQLDTSQASVPRDIRHKSTTTGSAEDTSITSQEETILDQSRSVVSELTIPAEVRIVEMSTSKVLIEMSKRATQVAGTFFTCGLPREIEEDFEGEFDDEEDDDDEESESEYSTSSGELDLDLDYFIPEINLKNCGY